MFIWENQQIIYKKILFNLFTYRLLNVYLHLIEVDLFYNCLYFVVPCSSALFSCYCYSEHKSDWSSFITYLGINFSVETLLIFNTHFVISSRDLFLDSRKSPKCYCLTKMFFLHRLNPTILSGLLAASSIVWGSLLRIINFKHTY